MQGKPAEAKTQYEQAFERRQRINGKTHPQTLEAISGLAEALEAQKLWTDGEPWRRNILQAMSKTEPVNSAGFAEAECALGQNLLRQKKKTDAEAALTQCCSYYASKLPEDWERWNAQSFLGEAIAANPTRYAEAEAMLLESIKKMKSLAVNSNNLEAQRIPETARVLTDLYEAWQ